MKYVIMVLLIIGAFIAGIYYENNRLVGEPDRTIALFISKTALDNAEFQIKKNKEYLEYLKDKNYYALESEITKITKIYTEIKTDALNVCERLQCNEQQKKLIMGSNKK